MPRADGSLYHFEREALKPEPKKPGRKPKPVAVVAPKEPAVTYANGREAHPLHPVRYAKAGRPMTIKATPEVIEQVCSSIKKGLSIESALILAGIQRAVVDKWRKLNPLVNQQFERAETEWESRIVGNIDRMAAADLKANTFLLERRLAPKWAPVTKSELTGKNGGAIQVHSLSAQLLASVGGDREPINVSPASDSKSPARQ